MTRTCLIITDRFEPTSDCLLAELRRRDIPCLRWNLDRFPLDSSLTYRFEDDRFSASISSDGRNVGLDSIGSVWCRGFRPAGFPDGLNEEDLKFVEHESQRVFDALLSLLKVPWINHPQCHARANSKPAQLRVAQEVGLDIPPTVITNDPQEVREFVAKAATETVYKAHSQSLNLEPGKALYTGLMTDKELDKLDLIRVSPGIFQAFVPKAYEVRATVVGTRIFAGKIESQSSEETRVDWRRRPYDIEKEPIFLPAEIEAKIHRFMESFGLIYGAFDFIVTPDGHHVFLEVNPAGQYLWVEATTKLPITAAIVDVLAEACLGSTNNRTSPGPAQGLRGVS